MREETHADFSARISERSADSGSLVGCHWDLTYRCNLACSHCYVQERTQEKELDTRQAVSILDRLSALGCLYIILSGGEPLLREDFFDIYRLARERGLLITLFTNGTLINDDMVNRLERYPPVMIEITVHSLRKEVFDAITQVKGSYDACMRGIRLLHSRGLRLVLKTVGIKDNADEISRIKEFAFSMEGVQFKFDPLVLSRHDGSREPSTYRLDPEEIVKLERTDKEMREQWKDYLEPGKCDRSGCSAGKGSFHLDPYGTARICPHMVEPSYRFTRSASGEGLAHFLQETRDRLFVTPAECKGCEAAAFCGQCPARALLESGDPAKPVEYLCRLARERSKILGRDLCRT